MAVYINCPATGCNEEVEVNYEVNGDSIDFDNECPECGKFFDSRTCDRIVELIEDEETFDEVVVRGSGY
jgi:hypothetical protein